MYLAGSIVVFVVFFANVVMGAFANKAFVGDVGEMLVLFAAAIPFVLCMFIVVLFIAYVPAISTSLLPDIYT